MSFTQLRGGRRPLVLLVGLTIPVALAACGGGSSADSGGTVTPTAISSDVPDDVRQAAMEAQSKNMLFITDHDELVKLAKEAGPVKGYISSEVADKVSEEFTKDTGIPATFEDFSGTDEYQRFLLEANSGRLKGIDIQQAPPEHYDEFRSLMAPYDILGMAKVGVLDIPEEMIDPQNRNVVAVGSQIAGYAYNPKLVDKSEIPTTWDGFCTSDFLDNHKFMLDVRPSNIAPLVADMGLEKVEQLVKCIKDKKPILTRGTTDALTRVASGEVPIHIFTNYHSVVRAMAKADGSLDVGLIDPVPIRLSNALGVMKDGINQNPYAGLLFIEWMASPKGQALLDEDPLKSSIYSDSSKVKAAVGDKKTVGAGFDNYIKMEDWMNTIVGDLGFPKS